MLSNTFSCFIIGSQSLLVQCAEALLQRHHRICGIISSDPLIVDWANEKDIFQTKPSSNLADVLRQEPFDYLFSIVNYSIIAEEILAMPRKGALNYHDSPLPRYAGVYATSWALMNQEKMHGITWHMMSKGVDEGDILKQHAVAVDDSDTAFTLNAKCYEAAIQAFSTVIDELADGSIEGRRQNLVQRTYCAIDQRPTAAGVLFWKQPADALSALTRALDFGPYVNPLGLPKLFMGEDVFLVPELEVLGSISHAAPGTITVLDPDGLQVATTSHEVMLRKLLTFDGQPLSIADFIARFGLRVGDRLPELAEEPAEHLTRLTQASCRHEAFWRKRLTGLISIDLPYASRNRTHTGSVRYGMTPLSIPIEATSLLKAGDDMLHRSDVLVSAVAAYLARLSDTYTFDLGFSHTALKRELAGHQPFFAPHIPLRVEIDPSASFQRTLDAIHTQLGLIRKHHSYARDLVLRYPTLSCLRDRNSTSLFPILVEQVVDTETYTPLPGSILTLLVSENAATCTWVHDTTVFDDENISRMQHQFVTFLRNIATDRHAALCRHSLLSADERQQLLVEWNTTQTDDALPTCLQQIFEAQVERTPNAVAVTFEQDRLTYRELNERANQMARYLLQKGVGPETLVGLYLERSLEMVIGVLGILKAGGAYLPIEPSCPTERFAFMLDDAQVRVIVTQQRLQQAVPGQGKQVICLDSDWEEIRREGEDNLDSGVTAENLAYVIYTSGSTGQPKGVLVNHHTVVRLFRATQAWFSFDSRDVWTLFHSIAFDFSVWELWGALLYGGRLVVVPYFVSRSPEAFYELVSKEEVTVLNQTPSAFRQFIAVEERVSVSGTQDLALRVVIFGGEALELQSLKPWFDRHGDERPQLVNMYGITETTVHVTYRRLKAADLKANSGSMIGVRIPDLQIYLLDKYLQPVPIGVPGELHIGGAGLARGYLDRPELTESRFIVHPFSEHPRERLYRSGDLARYLADGDIEYLGRIDDQVKIRGFRIELGEIESLLHQHPAVREAVVMAREDRLDDKRLVAYVVSQPRSVLARHELRNFLEQKVSDYMIPAVFIPLKSLPLTPNGKVDRQALPAPQEDRQTAENFVKPRNKVENAIARIWGDCLQVQHIGIHDTFFELGGHSLLMVEVLGKLQESLARKFSIVDMFRHPTVATFAEFATQKQEAESSFTQMHDLVKKEKEALLRQRKLATNRRKS